jgi:Mg-chelatase subunit ChlD
MKQGLVEIVLVVDRSGSMLVTRSDAEGGLRHFLERQKQVPGEARITLYRFNDVVERVFEAKSIGEVSESDLVIEPSGMTALLDAMGRAIDEVGARLEKTPEGERPSKVFVVTVTDGEENRSIKFTHKDVFDRVSVQRQAFSWEFVFIGANQDAIKTGRTIGVPAAQSLSYAATAKGTQGVYAALAGQVAASRMSGQAVAFTVGDRARALGQDPDPAPDPKLYRPQTGSVRGNS